MNASRESRFRQVMDGTDASGNASVLRAAAAGAEPFYSAMMRVRNGLYDAGIFRARFLGRPAISVGNITTGGTGKTPVVEWLAARLTAAGQRPAILMRGYKSTASGISDEQAILAAAGFPVIADPDRRRGAARAIAGKPEITAFILDDAMQHRRARRDFELVLIHAAEPFGFGRVFPRGLLREPLSGLRRADAILVTHSDEVTPGEMDAITFAVRRETKTAPIFHCDHVIRGLCGSAGESPSPANLCGQRYYAFCGIGSPESFFSRLSHAGGIPVGVRAFDDHHDYSAAEIADLAAAAKSAGAQTLITTAKDWVKLERFAAGAQVPILRAELFLRFREGHEEGLFDSIRKRIRA